MDVTEHRRADEDRERLPSHSWREPEAFRQEQNRILARIAANAPLQETLAALALLLESSCPGALCTVLLLDEDGSHLRHGAAPSLPGAFVKAIDGLEIGPAAGSCGTAMFRREAVLVTDIQQDPLWEKYRHIAALVGVRACWSVPILSDERRALGSFAIYYREARSPGAPETGAIEIVASVAGIAIERWRAEDTLRRSAARLRALVDGALDAVVGMDAGGRVLSWNPRAEAIFGWPAGEAIGRTVAELIVPAPQRDAHRNGLARYLATRESRLVGRRVELSALRRDGSEFPVELSVVATEDPAGMAFTAFIADITERKEAARRLADGVTELRLTERALRESEARYRSLFESAPDGILVADSHGVYLDANPSGLRMLGYSKDELTGMHSAEILAPQERPRVDVALAEINQGLAHRREWHFRRKDGSGFLADVMATVMTDGRILALVRDATERKRMESQLRQSQKMEAVGRLAGGIAHDFNNLLGVITGYAELLRNKTSEDHPDRRRIDQIVRAAERAAALTRQLLAFSRKQVLEPKVLEPSHVVADMRRLLERLIGEDVEFQLKAEATGRIKVDPGQLEQILMNLVVNARDAMPMGGSLSIETADVDLDEEHAQRREPAVPKGRYVMIAVADTGVGMDESTQAQVFEPFFTTKPEGKGTGLGLATVYGIVKQSGGYVWMYSEVGEGTVFRVYFPRVSGQVEEDRKRPPALSRQATETVLVVEDELAALDMVGEILRAEGYSVLLAENGQEAVDTATRAASGIHLLLTDVVLPKLSGRAAAERIRAIHRGIKVLYMSGYTDDQVSRHGVLEPGIALLQKPFTPADLIRRVGEILDEA